jgi:hypothetical protein
MTDTSNSSPSAQKEQKLKSLLFQGFVGAASLAGATAIPLLVQKALNPPTPSAAPAAVQASPSPVVEGSLTPQQQASPSPAAEESEPRGRRSREDRHRDKPPKR